MKKPPVICMAVLLLASTVIVSTVNGGAKAAAMPSPIAWYTFDNASDIGEDMTGNGNDLLAKGDPVVRSGGQNGNCVYLDGSSAMVAATDASGADFIDKIATTQKKFTLTYWFKVVSQDIAGFDPATMWRRIFSNGFDWGTSVGGFTSINNPDDVANPQYLWSNAMSDFEGGVRGDAGNPNLNAAPNTFTEQWTHIALTVDAVAKKTQYYVNGVLVCEFSPANRPDFNTVEFKLDNLDRAFAFGASYYVDSATGNDTFFQSYTGSVDEVAVFDTVLTPEQIAHYMNNRPGGAPTPTPTPTPTPDPTPVPTPTPTPDSKNPNLVAWYTFDDANNLGKDLSVYGNHLIPKGNAVSKTGGQRGNCLYLDGSSAMVAQLGSNGDFFDELVRTKKKFTLVYWFKVEKKDIVGFDPTATWRRIFSKGFDWGTSVGGFTSINNPDDVAKPKYLYSNTMSDFTTGAGDVRGDAGNPNLNAAANTFNQKWTYIALTVDAVAKKTQYYINGKLVCEYSPKNRPDFNDKEFKLDNITRAFAFGASYYADALGRDVFYQSYTGAIDEAGVFDTVLTPTQIRNYMRYRPGEKAQPSNSSEEPTDSSEVIDPKPNPNPQCPSLVAWYKFDDAGDLGRDSSGNGNHLSSKGNPALRADGQYDGCVYLDGNSAMVARTGKGGVDFIDVLAAENKKFTLTYWLKVVKQDIAGFDPAKTWRRVFSNGFDWNTSVGGFTGINNPDDLNAPQYLYSNTMSDFSGNVRGDAANPNLNAAALTFNEQWTHVALTVDAETNKTQYYINGKLQCEFSTENRPDFVGKVWKLDNPNRAFAYGASYYTKGGSDVFFQSYTGSLDDARVYDTVLTAEEVKACMENRDTGESQDPSGGDGSGGFMEGDNVVIRFDGVRNIVKAVKETYYVDVGMLDKSAKLKFWGDSPYIQTSLGETNALDLDQYKFMKIKYNARSKNKTSVLAFGTSADQMNDKPQGMFAFERKDQVWDELVFDMSAVKGWNGKASLLRMYLAPTSDDDTETVFIEYIAFFKTKAAADAFGGLTEEQKNGKDPVSFYFSRGYTHPLLPAAPEPEESSQPAGATAPDTPKAEKTGIPWGVIAVIGALIVAAVVAMVAVTMKKRKGGYHEKA
jgi:hypothetical protein